MKKIGVPFLGVGVLYILYLFFVASGSYGQSKAYTYMQKCAILLESNSDDEIDSFIKEVENNSKIIGASDAVAMSIAASTKIGNPTEAGIGNTLKICIEDLKKKLHK